MTRPTPSPALAAYDDAQRRRDAKDLLRIGFMGTARGIASMRGEVSDRILMDMLCEAVADAERKLGEVDVAEEVVRARLKASLRIAQ